LPAKKEYLEDNNYWNMVPCHIAIKQRIAKQPAVAEGQALGSRRMGVSVMQKAQRNNNYGENPFVVFVCPLRHGR
jgi:hypothetical protein